MAGAGFESDLVDFGPAFSGDEECLALRIVGDAVEHVVGMSDGFLGVDAREVECSKDLARSRIDANDAIGLPDVGKNFAFDEFEFVELIDVISSVHNGNFTRDAKAFGVDELELGGAIAHDQMSAIIGEAPAFALVTEVFLPSERGGIVDESLLVLPSQLVELAVEFGEAFAKKLGTQFAFDENFSCGDFYLP